MTRLVKLESVVVVCLLVSAASVLAEEARPLSPRALSEKVDLRMQELEPMIQKKELLASREPKDKPNFQVDSCVKGLDGHTSFGERIAYFTDRHINPRKIYFVDSATEAPLDYVNHFDLIASPSNVGLGSHPLCKMSEYHFYRSISREGSKDFNPFGREKMTAEEKAAAQTIIDKHAKLREAAKNGGREELDALIDYIAANSETIGLGVFKLLHDKSAGSGSPEVVAASTTFEKLRAKSRNKKAKEEDRKKAAKSLDEYVVSQSIESLSLALNLANNNIPDKETLARVNRFADEHNQYRAELLSPDKTVSDLGRRRLAALWTNLMSCIAYAESLTDPDSDRAVDLAGNDADEKPRKTKGDGIEWYMDQSQNGGAKQLAVGLFQFTPHSSPNQQPCVNAWNKIYNSCPIDPWKAKKDGTRAWNTDKMLDIISSPLQTFNANCGVNKIVQSFYIQVNTQETRRSHYSNRVDRKNPHSALKAPADRCVTPHFHSTLTFNHFGPLQNSTGNNLGKVMQCVY